MSTQVEHALARTIVRYRYIPEVRDTALEALFMLRRLRWQEAKRHGHVH